MCADNSLRFPNGRLCSPTAKDTHDWKIIGASAGEKYTFLPSIIDLAVSPPRRSALLNTDIGLEIIESLGCIAPIPLTIPNPATVVGKVNGRQCQARGGDAVGGSIPVDKERTRSSEHFPS